MMEDMIHPQEELSIDEIANPLGSQLFEFCESELFPETLQNSDVASSSNCCYEEHSSYPTQLSIAADTIQYNNQTTIDNEMRPPFASASPGSSTPTATSAPRNSNFSIIFDPTDDQIDNDISASIGFTPSPSFSLPHHCLQHNQEPFSVSSMNNQLPLGDQAVADGMLQYSTERRQVVAAMPQPAMVPMGLGPPIQGGYEEECAQMGSVSVPSYIQLKAGSQTCALIDPMIAPYLTAPFTADSSGFFAGSGLMFGTDISHQELEFQGDNAAFFLPDSIPRVFNCSSELQALSSESQHLVHGGMSNANLASEISSFEDPSYKVGKLSVEERRRKIHRYLKKRNERNFTKKIKYACRKTLADSRPRVRGRFAKNDELGENGRTNTGRNQDDDTDEDVSQCSNRKPDRKRNVKEEEDLEDSDLFTHINGVNSLKCNYPIQSWI